MICEHVKIYILNTDIYIYTSVILVILLICRKIEIIQCISLYVLDMMPTKYAYSSEANSCSHRPTQLLTVSLPCLAPFPPEITAMQPPADSNSSPFKHRHCLAVAVFYLQVSRPHGWTDVIFYLEFLHNHFLSSIWWG